jgi:DNA-binding LacI/PurR family transcriptional regulator
VDQQTTESGERAAKLALSQVGRRPSRPKQVVLKPRLVERPVYAEKESPITRKRYFLGRSGNGRP